MGRRETRRERRLSRAGRGSDAIGPEKVFSQVPPYKTSTGCVEAGNLRPPPATVNYNPGMSRESESPTRDGKASGSTEDRPLRRGTLLGGRYRIDSVLGYGGMGVVYRARDIKLDQDIALKRIRPDRMSPERQETLRR